MITKLKMTNKQRSRWKKMNPQRGIGQTYSTTNNPFTRRSYLEMQVKYDAYADTEDAQQSPLKDKVFLNENNHEKVPAGVSALLYQGKMENLYTVQEIKDLKAEIKADKTNFEKLMEMASITPTKVKHGSTERIRSDIVIPRIFQELGNGIKIETRYEKQGKAMGYQHMLYIDIPFTSFDDSDKYLGKKAKSKQEGQLTIGKENKNIVTEVIKVLACLSARHKKELLNILDIIIAS